MARQNVPPLRRQARLIPSEFGIGDKAAAAPMTAEEQLGLAQMAALSGVTANKEVTTFLRNVSNTTLTRSVQTLQNLVSGNL